ncbi:glutaredoxin 3 [Wenzhouxiangella sp. XN201]|uniref:glutaredoxin 3 n=1 Tax=Wenzhouxiangella sp. XN201 TaxID=2710755 RepID=UPI0013CA7501|nr:glutaredoxin 3 [Wenzhouxiangella sp. XN201]NEZ03370.1 glutaredoxin 3 [Wenzhouxiangella sp. XN201]
MPQSAVLIYATATCPFCTAARNLLRDKGVTWTEIAVDADPDKREEMIERSGQRSVPQIFIGDEHLGGFDDLDALDQEGALDRMLGL